MFWLLTLLVLALIAFYFVKTMMAKTQRQQAQHQIDQQQRLMISTDDLNEDSSSSTVSQHGTSSPATGDVRSDVRDMVKILNLDAPDANRLEISREQLIAIRKGETDVLLDENALQDLAARLRKMLD